MSDIFFIGLESWIIQDGNYGDFKVGQKRSFALEFNPVGHLHPTEYINNLSTTLKTESIYSVSGQVIHKPDNWWAVDVGIKAFRESKPPINLKTDDSFNGRIWLGIDPFFYFESLNKTDSAPALIYDWKILEILVQTAPFVKTKDNIMVRDKTKLNWRSISKTNAWRDDNGNAEYLLKCEQLSKHPRHEF